MTLEIDEVKDIRKRLGLTQGELAKQAGVSQSLIAKIESGKLDPTYSNAQKILGALKELSQKSEIMASEIMQKRVIGIEPGDTLRKAIETMKKFNISQMPVIENGSVLGIVSESSILEHLMVDKKAAAIKDVMADSPPVISQNTSLDVVSNLLRHFSLVIVAEKGKIAGIITKSDLINKLYSK